MAIVAVLAIILFGLAAVLLAVAALEPRARRTENLAGIEAYGYAAQEETTRPARERQTRRTLDELASSVGDLVARKFNVREQSIQRELVAAGYFGLGARRFVGYRALLAVAFPVVIVWLLAIAGASLLAIILLAAAGAALGWIVPGFVVHRRMTQRLRIVDDGLPALIDLLVVTLEAGVAFSAALRMAAERIEGPLGEEIRLTIQEQSLGISMLAALENWQRRCDTPAVRSFVRAMVQGDRLGVSIGQILRNQAVEMRARQKHTAEVRAQKAPVKIIFPLVFLIFPAMFVIILGPALFEISKAFHN